MCGEMNYLYWATIFLSLSFGFEILESDTATIIYLI